MDRERDYDPQRGSQLSIGQSLTLLTEELSSCEFQHVNNNGVAIRRYTKSRNVST